MSHWGLESCPAFVQSYKQRRLAEEAYNGPHLCSIRRVALSRIVLGQVVRAESYVM